MSAHYRTVGRPFDQGCVHCHSMEVSAVVRHSSTTKFELLCSLSVNLMSTTLSATSKKGLGRTMQELGGTSAGVNNCSAKRNSMSRTICSSVGRNPMCSSAQEGAESDAFWQEVCRNMMLAKTNVTKTCISKPCGKASEEQLSSLHPRSKI